MVWGSFPNPRGEVEESMLVVWQDVRVALEGVLRTYSVDVASP
jgi:hypothetical protein